MSRELTIAATTGSLRVDHKPVLGARSKKAEVLSALQPFYKSRSVMGGFEWLTFSGLTLNELPSTLSVCFADGEVAECHLSVNLPGAQMADGWPTRQAIDEEVQFVRNALGRQLGRTFDTGIEGFPWGSTWAHFDAKGGLATCGLRYEG